MKRVKKLIKSPDSKYIFVVELKKLRFDNICFISISFVNLNIESALIQREIFKYHINELSKPRLPGYVKK